MDLKIGIIGAGSLGGALSARLQKNLSAVYSRSGIIEGELYELIRDKIKTLDELVAISNFIILAVNDDSISRLAAEIASKTNSIEGKIFIHCSGSYPYTLLDSVKSRGAFIAAAHPFQTFAVTNLNEIEDVFDGVYWGIEGERLNIIEDFVKLLGGNPFQLNLEADEKAVYHASAIAAANFLSSTIALAADLATKAGIPKEFLNPIISTAVKNNMRQLPDIALTGPIARADVITIKNHTKQIPHENSLKERYIYSSLALLEAAYVKRKITESQHKELKKLLKENLPKD